jgi:hypothetical protein
MADRTACSASTDAGGFLKKSPDAFFAIGSPILKSTESYKTQAEKASGKTDAPMRRKSGYLAREARAACRFLKSQTYWWLCGFGKR